MICDICKKEPAIYGDGITWGRCAKCQLEATKNDPKPQEPEVEGEVIPHQTIPGLVSIIIPIYMNNYSLFHYTGNCIGSVREHTDQEKDPYELIIVDNGSPIQPPNLNSYYADKVIKWDENKGVTKAWNAGIRAAFGEYIVLLNNDAQVYNGWLSTMKKALDNGLDLVMAKPMYSLTEPFARAVEAKREQARWENVSVEESFEDFKDFSCVMFKKQLMDDVGMFDEQFFNYASDSDLLKRMDVVGKKYAVCKAVPTHHVIDATGYSINEQAVEALKQFIEKKGTTPEIMNEDKAKYAEKWSASNDFYGIDEATQHEEVLVIKEELEEIKGASEETLAIAESEAPLIRVEGEGDAIYLVKDQFVHWVTSLEILQALGYSLGQEKAISKEEFSKYTRGENVSTFSIERFKNA